jgi:hypothetical protein
MWIFSRKSRARARCRPARFVETAWQIRLQLRKEVESLFTHSVTARGIASAMSDKSITQARPHKLPTCNNFHFLVKNTAVKTVIANSTQLTAGRTGQEYNQGKARHAHCGRTVMFSAVSETFGDLNVVITDDTVFPLLP